MAGLNKYYRRSRISEHRFRKLARCFALDLTATDTAVLTGLSRRSVNELYGRIRLRLAEDLCRTDPDAAVAAIAAIRDEVHVAQSELRDLAHGVYPPVLTQHGLAEALRAAADRCPIPVEVRADSVGRVGPAAEAAVYFCCVEALQNVAKHAAGATEIHIDLHCDGDLGFQVADDGPGFSASQVQAGQGLANLRARLDPLGGTVDVISQPGYGTRVRGRVPARRSQTPW